MSSLAILTTIGALCMGVLAMIIRMRSAKRPASVKKIILPPIAMSSGFLMFFYAPAIPPTSRIIEALLVGMLFSIFLIKTSKFEIKGDKIYLKRSKAFMFILAGLLIARLIYKIIVGEVNLPELSGMFFILAYGMIVPWRIAMVVAFKKMEKELLGTKKEVATVVET